MGSFDGAEICELVGTFLLDKITRKYDNGRIGLYRDDGLAAFDVSPQKVERIKKDLCKIFLNYNLRITVEANIKTINYLDVTLDLSAGQYYPYCKPNHTPRYVSRESNHPPQIIKICQPQSTGDYATYHPMRRYLIKPPMSTSKLSTTAGSPTNSPNTSPPPQARF